MNELKIIEIEWTGPFTLKYVMDECKGASDYGIYQLYGTHTIFGTNALLYIGSATERPFATRMKEHDELWAKHESNEIKVHLGRIGGVNHPKEVEKGNFPEWDLQIDFAERLLVYFCSPPYNSSLIVNLGIDESEDVIVMNFGKKNCLPFEVSTLFEKSQYWEKETSKAWSLYKM